MNQAKFEEFSVAYRTGLERAVKAPNNHYAYGIAEVPGVVEKMLKAISTNPFGVNYGGEGLKRACKILGIKFTRKAILEFLEISSTKGD